jgi:hypothetical protein
MNFMLQYRVDLDGTAEGEANGRKKILERYLRYQDAAALEKHWINERLGWLFTPQSILFAALGFTYSDKMPADTAALGTIRAIIPVVAIAISIVAFIAVLSACVMHREWTLHMTKLSDDYKVPGDPDILTFGSTPRWPSAWARWSTLAIPIVFMLAWLVIFRRVVQCQ